MFNKAYAEETNVVETITVPSGAVVEVEQPNILMQLLPMILIFVVFYFLLIRPQMKKQKEHDAMIKSVKKGDNVIAAGGIFGKIVELDEKSASILVSENNVVKVVRSSISDKLDKKGDSAKPETTDEQPKASEQKKEKRNFKRPEVKKENKK